MAATAKHEMADVVTMWTATFLEVPATTTQWSWGLGRQRQVEAAIWKGYDAWVRVTKTAIDEVYKTSLFGEFAATTLDRTLRWQQWQQAIASAIAASVAPLTGLPTAAMVEAVQEEMQMLRARVTEQTAQLWALRTELQTEQVEQIPAHEVSRLSTARDAYAQSTSASRNGHRTMVTS